MTRLVAVVAHTHWDREWYAPFEHFRDRLVDVLDELLVMLEGDPSFRSFLLDGQMAMIDDFLEVRPEAAARIRRLVEQGRLDVGPWYVLMDEFCVSAETLVRNLQLGLRRAEVFGGSMPVGYLPDMFGHAGQMPQLLRLAGMAHAVVWRGVPAPVDRTAFWWEAPDGSTVRAEYLPVGYANGAHLPADPAALLRRMGAHEDELRSFLGDDSTPMLVMNGGDHLPPQPHLPGLLGAANQLQDRFDFQQESLADFLAAAPTTALPRWCGELRSAARANLLMGVLSNRVDLKVAAAIAERQLERCGRAAGHPVVAEGTLAGRAPGRCLAGTRAQLGPRLDLRLLGRCRRPGRASPLRRGDHPGERSDRPGPGPGRARTGHARTHPDQSRSHAGRRHRRGGAVRHRSGPGYPGPGAHAGRHRGAHRHGGRLRPPSRRAERSRMARATDARSTPNSTPGTASLEVVIVADASRRASPRMASVLGEAWAQAGAHRQDPLRVRVERRPSQRIVARVRGVPGYGWATFRPAELGAEAVHSGRTWLENSRVRVDVDPDDGTYSINGVAGLGRLVDDGEEGDTYNHSPPRADSVIQHPERVELQPVEGGPVRATVRMTEHFTWPAGLVDGCRAGERPVVIVTDIQLHAAEDFVRVAIRFDNPSRDHRLRAWFPLPQRTDHTVAECAFATVRRGAASGGPHELALATYPARRFVAAGGLTLTHEGLLEHELVDGGGALALTLLRATGMLSRPAPSARPNPAGPEVRLEATQLLGPQQARYAVAVGAINPWRLADAAWVAPRLIQASGTGRLPASGSRLVVRGAEVSALHRRSEDGAIEVRVFNPADEPAMVEIPDHSGWLVDLRGERLRRFTGRFGLRPWEVATACLDAASLDP